MTLIFRKKGGKILILNRNLGDCEDGLGVRLFLFTGALVVFGRAKLLGFLSMENLL
jgi:hypothetical protein